MASSSKQNDERSMFRTNSPHFFKIILDDAIRNGKVEIPKAFARMYGNSLSSPVTFHVPCGATWQVELINSDSEIWLQNGFKEFIEYYSISHGCFLVFRYEGNSNFYVVICNRSALEIDYPFSRINNGQEEKIQKPKVEEENDDAFLEISDEEEPPLSSSKRCKRMKRDNSTRVSNEQPEEKRCTESLSKKQRAVAICKAKTKFKSKSKYPFFMVVMQPTYVHGGTQVTIPATFARKYFISKNGDAILKANNNDRTWTVKYVRQGKCTARMSGSGWKEFAQENKLDVGNVCVFELIDRSEIKLRVSIIQGNKDANVCSSPGQSDKDANVRPSPGQSDKDANVCPSPGKIEKAKPCEESTSKYPKFGVVIKSTHLVNKVVYLPGKFLSARGKKKAVDVMLKAGNGQWPAKIIKHSSYDQYKLSAGWSAFSRENSLQIGDVCHFKLINGETPILEVSISRQDK